MDELEQSEFVQITASSIRSCEVILYPPLASVDKALAIVRDRSVKEYACILHDKDEKKPHIHCMIWLHNPTPTENVVKWFETLGVTASNLGRIKSRKGALAYLTHANRPLKFQYELTLVARSENIKEELETATNEALRKREIKALCDSVALGNLSPRSLYNSLNGVEIRENRKLIDESVNARLLKSSTIEVKDMKVFYIVGPAGSGKSTLARWLASQFSKEAPYISSSSNDPLQDYLLEPVIILDDLRGDSFKFVDLLKLLDNYVPSSVKCRYKNKAIDAKFLIITSTRRPEELYDKSVFTKDDNLDQLKRRIQAVYTIDKDGQVYQETYTWNEKEKRLQAMRLTIPLVRMEFVYKSLKIIQNAKTIVGEIADMFAQLEVEQSKKPKSATPPVAMAVPVDDDIDKGKAPSWLFDDDGGGDDE